MTSSSAACSPKGRMVLSEEVYLAISEQMYDKKSVFYWLALPWF